MNTAIKIMICAGMFSQVCLFASEFNVSEYFPKLPNTVSFEYAETSSASHKLDAENFDNPKTSLKGKVVFDFIKKSYYHKRYKWKR